MPRTTAVPGATVTAYQLAGAADKAQIVGFGQPKDLWSPASRTAVTTPDVGIGTYNVGTLTPVSTGDAAFLWVGGDCDTSLALIEFVVVLYESGGRPMGVTQTHQLSSGNKYTTSEGRFLVGGAPILVDLLGASHYALIVTNVSAGSWNLMAKLF
jgi:hypothetical protein